jgi:hypothetical protein
MGDKSCRFCTRDENSNHLFFDCSLARYVWILVAMVVGANCKPSNLNQFWVWCEKFLPVNRNLHTVGLAAICWALWQARNLVCFEKKKNQISYWYHLQAFILFELLGRSATRRSESKSGGRCGGVEGSSAASSSPTSWRQCWSGRSGHWSGTASLEDSTCCREKEGLKTRRKCYEVLLLFCSSDLLFFTLFQVCLSLRSPGWLSNLSFGDNA